MRCSCRKCGTYMVQTEQGLESGCKCPLCGEICRDCMGSAQGPMTPEELAAYFALGLLEETPEPEAGEALREELRRDWHKEL